MESRIKVKAPATLSNLNCGFDVIGMAIDVTNDEIIGKRINTPGVRLKLIGPHARSTPADPTKNTAGVAAQKYLEYFGIKTEGIELEVKKTLRPGSGLGSSASSACAAVLLAEALFRNGMSKRELLPFAILGEYAADHSFHADNVAPCLMGGIVLIRDLMRLEVHRVYVPQGLFVVAVYPEIKILTADARNVLSPNVTLRQMIRQSANLGSLILGMQNSDFKLVSDALEDCVIEPQRASLIPGIAEVKRSAFSSGALGCGISGAGPTMFALCNEENTARNVGAAMTEAFSANGYLSEVHVSRVSHQGTELC